MSNKGKLENKIHDLSKIPHIFCIDSDIVMDIQMKYNHMKNFIFKIV